MAVSPAVLIFNYRTPPEANFWIYLVDNKNLGFSILPILLLPLLVAPEIAGPLPA